LKNPALFLDRDGVINVDHGYVYKPEEIEFIDGIFELCHTAKNLGYLLIIITNQAGIGRGLYTEADFHKLTGWMARAFKDKDIVFDKVYFCPFHPEYGIGNYKKETNSRKPGPGMILQAEKELDIDLSRSILIGDKESDILAGVAAGVSHNILFIHGNKSGIVDTRASETVYSLSSVETILNHKALSYRN
jgi:D-glycero-D-manno-heptose 1,7-bisphosphate phosphatase